MVSLARTSGKEGVDRRPLFFLTGFLMEWNIILRHTYRFQPCFLSPR